MLLKSFLFIVVVVGAGVLVVEQGGHLAARGAGLFGLFRPSSQPSVTTISQPTTGAPVLPFVEESRGLAAGYQPVMKPYAGNLIIPSAHASVVMDVESGAVLQAHNADDQRQIASLTKLFTATIVMERIKDLDEPVTIDEESVYADGTRIGCPRSGFCNGERLKVGERISVRSLLMAALMNSANDAAIALGKHIGGTQAGFARIMNARAVELGLTDSHFVTPSGLEIDGHETEGYSSAHDVALIAAHALRFPMLWDIMRTEKTTIASVDGKYTHDIFNTDQLLGQFPNLVGTKTGFTPLAGYSLLAVAEDPSRRHEVVAVVLDDQNRWQSVRSMIDWSFQTFDWK